MATGSSARLNALRFVIAVVICEAAGVVGSVFTVPAIPVWYSTLRKPWFTPPAWLFAPVWLTLYLLMGATLYLLWNRRRRAVAALEAFAVQLALNVLWSAVFFGGHELFYGLIVIAALWTAIVATTILSYEVSRGAAGLLVPYAVWVTIASALNYYVWMLNV